MNKPDSIIIHHSLTIDGKTLSWGAIRRYHIDINRWDDIGYHFGIELAISQYEILLGRMVDVEGAHCSPHGYNRKSIGICLVGNFNEHMPPPEQIQKAVDLVLFLMRQYGISVDRVFGHREIDTRRTCPGDMMGMHNFRQEIKRRLVHG